MGALMIAAAAVPAFIYVLSDVAFEEENEKISRMSSNANSFILSVEVFLLTLNSESFLAAIVKVINFLVLYVRCGLIFTLIIMGVLLLYKKDMQYKYFPLGSIIVFGVLTVVLFFIGKSIAPFL